MKLKKGSLEAKRYMAKIRAMKDSTKKKSIGATKFVEKKEPKNTKPKRTIQITRRSDGTFKNFKSLGATKFVEKKEPKSTKPKRTIQITRRTDGTFKKFNQIGNIHKDTKSHNVRINVLSGLKKDVLTQLDNKYIKIDKYTEMKNVYAKMSKDKNINSYDRKHYNYMSNVANKHLLSLKKEITLLKKLI
jgi:hypothetical protein